MEREVEYSKTSRARQAKHGKGSVEVPRAKSTQWGGRKQLPRQGGEGPGPSLKHERSGFETVEEATPTRRVLSLKNKCGSWGLWCLWLKYLATASSCTWPSLPGSSPLAQPTNFPEGQPQGTGDLPHEHALYPSLATIFAL